MISSVNLSPKPLFGTSVKFYKYYFPKLYFYIYSASAEKKKLKIIKYFKKWFTSECPIHLHTKHLQYKQLKEKKK